eukprot:GHVH01007693.1.p1 GENE.GHVH01007693.1~~GHVH01007693.1.p1  ORF type:complete len:264 (+),score=46.27 GHVH01007693.1:721-1512(+)
MLRIHQSILYGAFWPILIIVVLTVILRSTISSAIPKGNASKPPSEFVMKEQVADEFLNYSKRVRTLGSVLTPRGLAARRHFLVESPHSPLKHMPIKKGIMESLSMMGTNNDPSGVMNMVKGQFTFVALNGGLGYLISFLFSGYIVARIPFTLTFKFRSMLQRGLVIPALDVNYVSSLSWYFFIFMGCSSLVNLAHILLHPTSTEEVSSPTDQMMGGTAGETNPFAAMSLGKDKTEEAVAEMELWNQPLKWSSGAASFSLLNLL